jgi:hypothetical protein
MHSPALDATIMARATIMDATIVHILYVQYYIYIHTLMARAASRILPKK